MLWGILRISSTLSLGALSDDVVNLTLCCNREWVMNEPVSIPFATAIAVTMLSKHTILYMLKSKNEKKLLKPKLNTHSFHVLQSYYVGPIPAERSIDQCKTKEGLTLSFLRALNFLRHSTVSCLWNIEATVDRCWKEKNAITTWTNINHACCLDIDVE